MKKITLLLIVTSSLIFSIGYADYVQVHLEHAPMGDIKGLVPISSGDPSVQQAKLQSIVNIYHTIGEWGGKVTDFKIVLYGKGLTLLENPSAQLKKLIDELRSLGAQFLICNITLSVNNIDYHSLYNVKEQDIVPSGSLEVIYLQQKKGYSINPIN